MRKPWKSTRRPALLAALSLLLLTLGARPLPATEAADDAPLDVATMVFFRPLASAPTAAPADTPAQVALGRKLFFERALSLNNSQSCNDCHRLDGGLPGTDGLAVARGATCKAGTRNTPTVLNTSLQRVQFWDGRAHDLVEQATGPILNPVEMAMPSREEVIGRLKASAEYRRDFTLAFPGQADPLTLENLARAIAAFERTLLTPARFDRYLQGDRQALSAAEKHGLHRFQQLGCVECHSSHPVGGRLIQKLGVHHPYANGKDLGRYEVTRQEEDRYRFKVPMLRNVTRTAPYFHDGQVTTLDEAVRQMAWMQLNVKLAPAERAEIISFLHALEGERASLIAAK